MYHTTISDDTLVYCLKASSFPNGVGAVYDKLHAEYPPEGGRSYFGRSRPAPDGKITYMAAVKLNDTDGIPPSEYERFTINKGRYVAKDIGNYMANLPAIGAAFAEMIREPDVAPDGYCLEVYLSPTALTCMVKLTD
ncbi:MAG: hypothetical protein IAE95_03000 [Chitinophagaceae bacterium]|nr:hypothetical protein [Chitinophagaceae bacterium]